MTRDLVVRPATRKDTKALAQLARALDEAAITQAALNRDVFGATPGVRVAVAALDGAIVAAAFYTRAYDVPTAKRGFMISRFLISDTARARDVGSALVAGLAALGKKQKAVFLQWTSDAWSVDEHDVYRRLGAAEVPVMAHAVQGTKFNGMAKIGATFLKR